MGPSRFPLRVRRLFLPLLVATLGIFGSFMYFYMDGVSDTWNTYIPSSLRGGLGKESETNSNAIYSAPPTSSHVELEFEEVEVISMPPIPNESESAEGVEVGPQPGGSEDTATEAPLTLALGFISKTYIISLPHRTDRRTDMAKLMGLLNFGTGVHNTNLNPSQGPEIEGNLEEDTSLYGWVYHPGTYANTSLIDDLMRHVQWERTKAGEPEPPGKYSEDVDVVRLPFEWPEDAKDGWFEDGTLPLAGAELWSSSPADTSSPDPPPPSLILPTPMICAEDDFRLSAWSETMLQWRFLTRERVAAYHSHLMAVRRVVDDNAKARAQAKNAGSASIQEGEKAEKPRVALILEDDVDMEVDIEQRLEGLVPLLPENWDVLYLGFCWSTETTHSPLTPSSPFSTVRSKNQIYPSFQPRCLHAYALSEQGAIKVLKYLRHPPFAYGRSVDLAMEWLVWEHLLNSYTIVPPVVIQRKISKTDITLEGGAVWKEKLDEGVLGTTESGDEV